MISTLLIILLSIILISCVILLICWFAGVFKNKKSKSSPPSCPSSSPSSCFPSTKTYEGFKERQKRFVCNSPCEVKDWGNRKTCVNPTKEGIGYFDDCSPQKPIVQKCKPAPGFPDSTECIVDKDGYCNGVQFQEGSFASGCDWY